MSIIDSAYKRLPVWMQNMAISAYGARQRLLRHGTDLPSQYVRAFDPANSSPARIKQLQNDRLKALIEHACTYVPHYRELVHQLRVSPKDIDIDNFDSLIPILEKSDVVADPTRFHSQFAQRSNLKLFTSGTSGSPMPILCTREARTINYAFFRRIIEGNGSRLTDKSVTFAGRTLFSNQESRRFWRKDFVNNTLYCSSYYLSPSSIPGYIEAMESWNPQYIDTYPSALYEIARYINANHIRHRIKPRFILTSSETLTDLHRSELEKAFGCKIVDQYGCTEMAVMACSKGARYFVEPMYSLVEFAPHPQVVDGQSLVVTGLLNFAMPLLRYRIGDLVVAPQFDPAQRFQTSSFGAVLGREDDCILTPEGRRVGRMDPAFKGVNGILRAQIVQRTLTDLEILIVRSDTASSFDENLLKDNICNRTSPQMTVTIRFVNEIPLTKAGKFKAVVSLL